MAVHFRGSCIDVYLTATKIKCIRKRVEIGEKIKDYWLGFLLIEFITKGTWGHSKNQCKLVET